MLALLNAIYSHFTATSALTTGFSGGLHRDRAPEGTTMPYVVSRIVSSKAETSYGPGSRTTTQIKLSAFGVGHDATGTSAGLIVSAFDGTLLSLASGTNDSVVRLGDPVPAIHSQDGTGNDVWEWAVTYEYGVS